MLHVRYFSSTVFSCHGFELRVGFYNLKAGELCEKGLLTTFSQRQKHMSTAAVHGADITGWAVAARFIWFRISALMAQMRSMLFGRTHNDILRELEAQHPLVSGWKPDFLVLFSPAQVLKNAFT